MSLRFIRVIGIRAPAIAALLLFTIKPALSQNRDSLLHVAEHSNWYVRLTTPALTFEGRGAHVTRDSVFLREFRVARSDITAIDRRVRRGGGGLPGGLFGAATMGALVHGFYEGMCESSCSGGTGALIGGAAMGFVVGSAIGALVAPGRPEWHPQFPSTSAEPYPSATQTPTDTTAVADATGTLVFYAGGGMIFDAHGEGAIMTKRFGLQLGFPASVQSRAEVTADVFAMVVGDAGLLGFTIGPNFPTSSQNYFGVSAGVAAIADDYVYDIGARVGHRPGRHGVLRPEARLDVLWRERETVLSLQASLGLQIR